MTASRDLSERIRKAHALLRASRGDLDKGGRGEFTGRESFIRDLDMAKNPGRQHALKKHFKYGTAAYELCGYLESLEERFVNPERFIFASQKKMMEKCSKGEIADGKSFSRREFFNALKLLRNLGIVSPLVTRDGREGVIVAPHAALCLQENKRCRFVGPTIVNRKHRGLVGRFTIYRDEGFIWHADDKIIQSE